MSEKYDITIKDGIKGAKPRKIAIQKKNREGSWLYLSVVGQIGYTIAIPLVFGVLIGYFIDRNLGTRPVGTLIGLGLGSIISVIGFARTLKKLL